MEESIPLRTLSSPRVRAAPDVEEFCLDLVPGLGTEPRGDGGGRVPASCCGDRHHRTLAVCSIVCGCSCIGYQALINSVKAETSTDPEAADKFSRRARKLGFLSIVTWVLVLVSIPLLVVLLSYLITIMD